MNLKKLALPVINVCHKASAMTLSYASGLAERAATQPLGQFLIQKTEDLIWAFEKSIEWSLPSEVKGSTEQTGKEPEQNGHKEKVTTSRPLPWVIFIPVLVVWRCAKFAYESASAMVGKPPVKPVDMVHFLRNQRRNLRAVRIRGKRTMTSRDASPTALSKLRSFVQHTLSRAACFSGPDTEMEEAKTCMEVKAHAGLAEEEEDTENVLEKLNRLSREEDNVENDPDYEPGETSVSSGGSTSSEEDRNESATPGDAGDTGVARSSFVGDAIAEEDESAEAENSAGGDSTQSRATRPTSDDESAYFSVSGRSSASLDGHDTPAPTQTTL